MSFLRRYLPLLTLLFAVASFYLFDLAGVGLLGPDEPRYAAIGRGMAETGDWITPSLWGSPWYEKPPLIYWLTAIATSLGAGPELSARLPVAILSLAFLCVFYWLVFREFGLFAATFATATLSTSVGWIAYSNLCLTDLPLACFFSLSLFFLLPLLRPVPAPTQSRLLLSGVFLGLAILAKGLVPLVLIFPASWFLRRLWRQWWISAVACLVVALPWYLIMIKEHGNEFIQDFFLKQHFERLYSPSLQHVQPWYFYLPVLLGLLFPWTPLFIRLGQKSRFDQRHWFLLSIVAFGLLFFSSSLNKLPGYLIPLLPALFAVLGAAFASETPVVLGKRWLLPSACLIALIPLIAQGLPSVLSAGRMSAIQLGRLSATTLFYVFAPLAVILVARRSWAPVVLVLTVIAGGFYLKIKAFPILDEQVSARKFWQNEIKPIAGSVCEEWIKRDWVYGLSFYWGRLIPPCYLHPTVWHLLPRPSTAPALVKK